MEKYLYDPYDPNEITVELREKLKDGDEVCLKSKTYNYSKDICEVDKRNLENHTLVQRTFKLYKKGKITSSPLFAVLYKDEFCPESKIVSINGSGKIRERLEYRYGVPVGYVDVDERLPLGKSSEISISGIHKEELPKFCENFGNLGKYLLKKVRQCRGVIR